MNLKNIFLSLLLLQTVLPGIKKSTSHFRKKRLCHKTTYEKYYTTNNFFVFKTSEGSIFLLSLWEIIKKERGRPYTYSDVLLTQKETKLFWQESVIRFDSLFIETTVFQHDRSKKYTDVQIFFFRCFLLREIEYTWLSFFSPKFVLLDTPYYKKLSENIFQLMNLFSVWSTLYKTPTKIKNLNIMEYDSNFFIRTITLFHFKKWL